MIIISIILVLIIILIITYIKISMNNSSKLGMGEDNPHNEMNREEIMDMLGYKDEDIKYINLHKQMFLGRHKLKKGKTINDIIITKEGAYSFTSSRYMDDILRHANKFFMGDINTASDITANIGASALTMADYYNVVAYEINEETFMIMEYNLSLFDKNIECINDSFFNHISDINNTDLVFYDPPWGGPEYKEHETYDIVINDHGLEDVANLITTNIIMKLPLNADISFVHNLGRDYKKFYTEKKGKKKWLNLMIRAHN